MKEILQIFLFIFLNLVFNLFFHIIFYSAFPVPSIFRGANANWGSFLPQNYAGLGRKESAKVRKADSPRGEVQISGRRERGRS